MKKCKIKKILISELNIKVKCAYFYCLPKLKPFVQFKMIKLIYVRSCPCRSLLVEFFCPLLFFLSRWTMCILYMVINSNIIILIEPKDQEWAWIDNKCITIEIFTLDVNRFRFDFGSICMRHQNGIIFQYFQNHAVCDIEWNQMVFPIPLNPWQNE